MTRGQEMLKMLHENLDKAKAHYNQLRESETWDSLPIPVQDHVAGIMDSVLNLKALARDGAELADIAECLMEANQNRRTPPHLPYTLRILSAYLVDKDYDLVDEIDPKPPHGIWEHAALQLNLEGFDVTPKALSKCMNKRPDRWMLVNALAWNLAARRNEIEIEEQLKTNL